MPALRDSIAASAITKRTDYTPPAFWIDTVDLTFDLDATKTRVLNKMTVRRNPDAPVQPLRLDGEELNLARVLINGQGTSFKLEDDKLVLENLPEGDAPFELEIFTTCAPDKNTQLMGLYVSQGSFFTQCESEGFRRITYFLDRPDVMSTYKVTLRADKTLYPVLLSNGNLLDQGDLEDGRHYAVWQDPHKKPCYLFALVAGVLVAREQYITTRAGHQHLLQVYVRPGDLDKTEHAMQSLINSIRWDEARFGLPLDLERFMIVAVGDFNMGAMENKGLNIFNTQYVLAKPSTATDSDYDGIESIIGHEYFHNWTGNRVTCRDWFQLSLKEGLTVFRDQEFSEDLADTPSARAVRRIDTVRNLRSRQFSEDAGPMAHPVRPDQYQEISNFYTSTVYEKGAEVVRMYQTLVGKAGFRKGMDLYFQRHDGQAVTCDDFAQAMADANPNSVLAKQLDIFKRWYSQSGTPVVHANGVYNAQDKSYTITFQQSCPATPGQASKQPFLIPIRMGLLDAQGQAIALHVEGDDSAAETEKVLVITQEEQSFTFRQVESAPVPSLLRQFSAPVWLNCANNGQDELLHLLAHDSDAFNRWEAAQTLILNQALAALQTDTLPEPVLSAATIDALRSVLQNPALDAAFKTLVLTLPSEQEIAEKQNAPIDPQRIKQLHASMNQQLAHALQAQWEVAWKDNHDTGAYRPDPVSAGKRALANMALKNLCVAASSTGNTVWAGKAYQRSKTASNMTDRMGAMKALLESQSALAPKALTHFYALFKDDALVLDKWFALQAGRSDADGASSSVLDDVKQLTRHPDFTLNNPNRMRSLISVFCHRNPGAFHRTDAAGYVFWSEQVLALDAINAQIAARLARAMDHWKRLAEPYRSAAEEAIRRVAAKPDLSKDVREVVSRALAD